MIDTHDQVYNSTFCRHYPFPGLDRYRAAVLEHLSDPALYGAHGLLDWNELRRRVAPLAADAHEYARFPALWHALDDIRWRDDTPDRVAISRNITGGLNVGYDRPDLIPAHLRQ